MTGDAGDTIDGFVRTRKPDLELLVEITTSLHTVNRHCCVFLPRRSQDKPRLLLLPTYDQAVALHYPPFKLHAETGQNVLHSDEVHLLASESTSWSSGISIERMLCEPWHFDFVEIIDKPTELADPAPKAERLKLLLTPSQLLTPFMTSHLHSDGSIDVKKVTRSRSSLPRGRRLTSRARSNLRKLPMVEF